MKVTGSSVLQAPPDRVWAAITDPDVLAGVIPGCDGLIPLSPDRFRLTVSLGVASIKGTYTGEVSFADMVVPGSLTLRASGSGAPGTIDTTVAVVLTDLGATTRVDYDADAIVGGMVGGVGQRMLGAVAKRTADAFFAAIDATFTAAPEPAATGAAPATGALPGEVPPTALPRVRPPARGRWDLLGATAAGAISMLVGILVGLRIGRSRPRPVPGPRSRS